MENAQVIHTAKEFYVKLPMAQPSGKVRVKKRNSFADYGIPVASRSTQLSQSNYIEWQIGYDTLANSENAKLTTLNKKHFLFENYKGETKYPYELSEILYYAFENKLIAIKDIRRVYDEIKAVAETKLLDVIDSMRISRTNPLETNINGVDFYEMKVSYQLIVHKFGKYDIYAEVINREKQRAVGVQPMLYVCIPLSLLDYSEPKFGRATTIKECAKWHITKDEGELALELFRIFGMLSSKHKSDTLAIMKVLFGNILL
ncbi:restriction endonuclease [Fibrobacterales bacterium]|nr:restriction endonuclease [Fibrobacterales bacterium]